MNDGGEVWQGREGSEAVSCMKDFGDTLNFPQWIRRETLWEESEMELLMLEKS